MNVKLFEYIFLLFLVFIIWPMGIALAKGFWLTFFSIIFPPTAVYLVVEHILKLIGWVV